MIGKPAKRENTPQFLGLFLIGAFAQRNFSVVPSPLRFEKMSVSTHPRRLEQSGEVLAAHVLGFAGGTRSLDGLEVVTDKHTKQIASLTSQIEVKNEEISKFNEDLKDLRRQNNDLKITVESKDEEIEALKEQINKLANEKKALQTTLREVKGELEAVRKEVVDLKGENSSLKGKIEQLESEKEALERNLRSVEGQLNDVRQEVVELKNENSNNKRRNAALDLNVKKLSNRVDEMTRTLEESTRDNSNLKKEVKNLRDAALQGTASFMPSSFLADPVEKASLLLGELCRQIQAMMYQKVLPNSPYDDKKSYKVKYMLEDIEELEDEQEKTEAEKRWQALQKKLNWKKTKHTRAMKSIQDNRNDTAHPDLDEKQLAESVELMKQRGNLSGYCPPERVNELIEMWKILSQ